MRKSIFFIFFLLTNYCVFAQVTVSGVLDSTVSLSATSKDSNNIEKFSMGVEEFANIRFQAKQENYAVYCAINLLAASGDFVLKAEELATSKTDSPLASSSYVAGDNYIAGIELERLYFRLLGEYTNFDGGLMRLPFGYSQVWGSSDFLNPKNPLKPDARPRGILGAAFSWFPDDAIKFLAFCSAPRDPFSADGGGYLFGLMLDRHWDMMSIQSLYSYETPDTGSEQGLHRIGLSIKADLVVGLLLDALYTYNHEAESAQDGLSCSFGVDYSFLDGKLILLVEYLFNGENSSTAFDEEKNILGSPNMHNLYGGLTVRFSDFTNLTAAFIYGYDLYTPVLTFNHELFHGATLTLTAQAPFDSDSFYGVNFTARIRLRF